ncbi:pyridoxamine 5'-phosphate oxidase [Glaciihabitans tibetensis]|uniref:Pyridoxamine 5'-phosphate oxidase n=2 Tax=Glaciihabitans tibetensis TaxID=1266600 RepID=A0A2T0VHC8_9MICO|nr:pyridoxamine 5'-phosphate oxidase [Glaciihabitans tibetensis]
MGAQYLARLAGMSTPISLRSRLGSLKAFGGELPVFNTDAAPDEPMSLLIEWVTAAIDADVVQPHAMALATSTMRGEPSNRTLLLKDVDLEAVWFASLSSGPKGDDIAQNPRAALLLYWREQGRQIRIVGAVEPGPREVSEADFLARSPRSRAGAIAGPQSEPLTDFEAAVDVARARFEREPDYVPNDWTAYRVVPDSVEFWQAERARDQVRLRYRRDGDRWTKELLWP